MAEHFNTGLSHYVANFNSQAYIRWSTLGTDESLNATQLLTWFATELHNVFSKLDPEGDRLLEIGSGPTVRNVLSASAKYKDITLSDPVPDNTHMLEQYMRDLGQDATWLEHFKLTAKLEGDETKWPQVRERLRSSIKHVLRCDVQQTQPLGEQQPKEPYDCVMSILCLEQASKNFEPFRNAVKNLVSLAKPGGAVVFGGVLGETFYAFGGRKFVSFPSTPEIVRRVVEDTDCTIKSLKIQKMPSHMPASDLEAVYMMEARKNI